MPEIKSDGEESALHAAADWLFESAVPLYALFGVMIPWGMLVAASGSAFGLPWAAAGVAGLLAVRESRRLPEIAFCRRYFAAVFASFYAARPLRYYAMAFGGLALTAIALSFLGAAGG